MSRPIEFPTRIGGRETRPGRTADAVMPLRHRHMLAKVHQAGPEEVQAAIAAAREAWHDWSRRSLAERAAAFLKAADLLPTRWRARVNGPARLGPSETASQAELQPAGDLLC